MLLLGRQVIVWALWTRIQAPKPLGAYGSLLIYFFEVFLSVFVLTHSQRGRNGNFPQNWVHAVFLRNAYSLSLRLTEKETYLEREHLHFILMQNVLSLDNQLKLFRKYISKLRAAVGENFNHNFPECLLGLRRKQRHHQHLFLVSSPKPQVQHSLLC